MSQHDIRSAERPAPDQVLVDIADYVCNYEVDSELAYETAHYCLMDTLACGFQALDYPACTKLLGPVVPGATLPGGARVPGTSYELEPVMVVELGPLDDANKRDARNWALRNIPYYWDKACVVGLSPERLNELYASIHEEYALYRWATGVPHRYETMTRETICSERGSQ